MYLFMVNILQLFNMSSFEQQFAYVGSGAEFMNWDEEIMASEAREADALAAYVALKAASCAEGKRNRLQFTGGNYLCPGPLPGVTCMNTYGKRHYSPFYKGTDWKCPHCRKRKYKFSAIIESKGYVQKLSVNSAPSK
jgi:hypothetical protein